MSKQINRHLLSAFLVLVLGVTVATLPATAATEWQGVTRAGAHCEIHVPDGWQPAHGLVIWNHGYNGLPLEEALWMGPMAAHHLAAGYAVAATSYRDTEWAVFYVLDDIRDLLAIFEAEFGAPDHIFLSGLSMGGLITTRVIEEGGFDNIVGALTHCGAMGPTSRTWDLFHDLRLIYDVVCGDVPGAAIPGGAWGLPMGDSSFEPHWQDVFNPAPSESNPIYLALERCTGLTSLPAQRTPEQQQRLDRILALSGIEEEFLGPDLFLGTLGVRDLIRDPLKLNGSMPFDNFEVDYGDPEINAAIERVRAEPEARHKLNASYTPTGRVGGVKIIALHTDKDGIVPVEQLQSYAEIVPPENLTVGVAVEDVPSHCVQTEAELLGAWRALRAWVAGAPQPTAQTLQNNCRAVVLGRLAEGPCRFAPDFVIGDLDERLPKRGACTANGSTLCLDEGRFRVRVAWQDLDGHQGPGRVAPHSDRSGSFWFFHPDNLELTVKMLDGRQVNGHHWLFYGSLSDVRFELTVTDTVTGLERIYLNPRGLIAGHGDTHAF